MADQWQDENPFGGADVIRAQALEIMDLRERLDEAKRVIVRRAPKRERQLTFGDVLGPGDYHRMER
jgi:hypothetical protein